MKTILIKLILGVGLTISAVAAYADLITPLVSIQEKANYDQDGNWLNNQYIVTNNSSFKEHDIYAFAVTNPASSSVWTNRESWFGTSLSREEWNSFFGMKGFCNLLGCPGASTGAGTTYMEFGIIYLGSFESLFGTEEEYVNLYWSYSDNLVAHQTSGDEFFFSTPLASEYVAFGVDGSVIYQSFQSAPEPGSILLISLAIALLAAGLRRPNA